MTTSQKIITFALLIFSTPVFAQEHFIGVKAGANLTNVLQADFWGDTDNRFGLNAGLTYEFVINDFFAVGADLQYAQKGFKTRNVFTDESGDILAELTNSFNYDYISVPLKGGIVFGDKFSGFFNLGIVPSVLIQAKTIQPGFTEFPQIEYITTDQVTRFDLGAMAEVGANYSIGSKYVVFASAGFQQSFISIMNKLYSSPNTVKHYGLSLSLGVKYLLKS